MSMGNVKSHTVGILWERLIYSHIYSLTLPSHIKDNPWISRKNHKAVNIKNIVNIVIKT